MEPIFGIIKAACGFSRFQLSGLVGVAAKWTLVRVAFNLRRLHRLRRTAA